MKQHPSSLFFVYKLYDQNPLHLISWSSWYIFVLLQHLITFSKSSLGHLNYPGYPHHPCHFCHLHHPCHPDDPGHPTHPHHPGHLRHLRHSCHPLNCALFSKVVQNRLSAMWFKGKELAFAFGCILAFSRLVS